VGTWSRRSKHGSHFCRPRKPSLFPVVHTTTVGLVWEQRDTTNLKRMFATGYNDDNSVASRNLDGIDIQSKRSLLKRLHHAAYCSHEGYTVNNLCPRDHLCCAAKRLFMHMSGCNDGRCDIPCCKNSRRIWNHYRKCRHVHNCPICCSVASAFSPEGVAPRFSKLISTESVEATPGAYASPSTGASVDSSGAASTAAVVSPHAPRAPGHRESTNDSVNPKAPISREVHRQPILPKQPAAPRQQVTSPTPPPTSTSTHHTNNSLPPKPVTPNPYSAVPRSTNDSPKLVTGAIQKPPLSPRRPQWALF
jgi:TAZ zinc finger